MTVIRVIEALLLLSVLVMIHELGHYTAGRLLGFTILEYAIGMGPKLLGFKKNGIEYNLRLLPLGGMCRFYGEDDGVADERCFNAQKAWKRFIVILSGPLMNFVLAFVLAMILLLGWGVTDETKVMVQSVTQNGPADAAGIEIGDQFLRVDGQPVDSFEALTDAVAAADPDRMEVVVLRDGEEQTLIFSDLYNAERDTNFMDVVITYGVKRVGVFTAMQDSAAYCREMAGLVFKSLGMLFTREASLQDMAGPVGIVQLLGEAAESGWYTVLNLCILLSVNLGVFNLFPIPGLDGGRILFILIEWIRRKPVPPEKEGLVHLIGLGLLLILVVVITFNDVLRLIRG